MNIKYYVYQVIYGGVNYLRIDESGTHWMETSKSLATPISYKKAISIARANNKEARQGGYYGAWGYCRTDSIWN